MSEWCCYVNEMAVCTWYRCIECNISCKRLYRSSAFRNFDLGYHVHIIGRWVDCCSVVEVVNGFMEECLFSCSSNVFSHKFFWSSVVNFQAEKMLYDFKRTFRFAVIFWTVQLSLTRADYGPGG
ncbi:hypothetical protein HS088_TW08G00349 [Tripterygium wilfordii]|uniref:Uncharacterized protein n=1 Tax=Tripterygium wilfordii TaxID=458696 RepID=A0A7J7DBN1_TRIWF|nr:hypothetical protein HS088_TW08G00349 [Tripterygium wilfordii]